MKAKINDNLYLEPDRIIYFIFDDKSQTCNWLFYDLTQVYTGGPDVAVDLKKYLNESYQFLPNLTCINENFFINLNTLTASLYNKESATIHWHFKGLNQAFAAPAQYADDFKAVLNELHNRAVQNNIFN